MITERDDARTVGDRALPTMTREIAIPNDVAQPSARLESKCKGRVTPRCRSSHRWFERSKEGGLKLLPHVRVDPISRPTIGSGLDLDLVVGPGKRRCRHRTCRIDPFKLGSDDVHDLFLELEMWN